MKRAKTWVCRRQTNGVKCLTVNPSRRQKCSECGKTRPVRKEPAHRSALDQPYEHFLALNGGVEACGICGAPPKPGRRLHRDHDHRTGRPRGLACFRCNAALRPYMTLDWLRRAVAYLERTA